MGEGLEQLAASLKFSIFSSEPQEGKRNGKSSGTTG